MNSTSQRSCTGFVPESITGGSAAGQDSGVRYRSRLVMKRTTGNADQGDRGESAADLHVDVLPGTGRYSPVRPRVVPDFYRRTRRDLVNIIGAILLFPIFYVFAVLLDWQDRKAGVR